jgi:hypothetical protein
LPARFRARIEAVFGLLAADSHAIEAAIAGLEDVAIDTKKLIKACRQ